MRGNEYELVCFFFRPDRRAEETCRASSPSALASRSHGRSAPRWECPARARCAPWRHSCLQRPPSSPRSMSLCRRGHRALSRSPRSSHGPQAWRLLRRAVWLSVCEGNGQRLIRRQVWLSRTHGYDILQWRRRRCAARLSPRPLTSSLNKASGVCNRPRRASAAHELLCAGVLSQAHTHPTVLHGFACGQPKATTA